MAEACLICGTTTADTYRYCSTRRGFVCINCERGCNHFSRKLLPNGCNCKLTYMYPFRKYVSFLANSEEIEAAKAKYLNMTNQVLESRYKALHDTHNKSDSSENRTKLRVELAAISELLSQRGA